MNPGCCGRIQLDGALNEKPCDLFAHREQMSWGSSLQWPRCFIPESSPSSTRRSSPSPAILLPSKEHQCRFGLAIRLEVIALRLIGLAKNIDFTIMTQAILVLVSRHCRLVNPLNLVSWIVSEKNASIYLISI